MKVSFISLGCAKNLVNTEQMMALCREAGIELQEQPEGADAVVIATEWTEFSALAFAELKAALRQPVLFDLRNVYRKAEAEAAGLEYHGTGVAPTQGSAGA